VSPWAGGPGLCGGACTRHRNWSGGDSPSYATVTICRIDGSPQKSQGGGSNLMVTGDRSSEMIAGR
jgi:hypothetical protein